MIKVLIIEDDRTIIHVYALNQRDSKFPEQKWAGQKKELEKSTVTVPDLNTPLSVTDRTRRKDHVTYR